VWTICCVLKKFYLVFVVFVGVLLGFGAVGVVEAGGSGLMTVYRKMLKFARE